VVRAITEGVTALSAAPEAILRKSRRETINTPYKLGLIRVKYSLNY
jgi:hypothetical protein